MPRLANWTPNPIGPIRFRGCVPYLENMKSQVEIIGQIGNIERSLPDGRIEDHPAINLSKLIAGENNRGIAIEHFAFYAASAARALHDAFLEQVPENQKEQFAEEYRKYVLETMKPDHQVLLLKEGDYIIINDENKL